jgi:hypothetical protein
MTPERTIYARKAGGKHNISAWLFAEAVHIVDKLSAWPNIGRPHTRAAWALIFGGMIPLGSLEAGLRADFIGAPATIATARWSAPSLP